jgi:hypothetical protein
MSNIRVTYSGLISLATRLISVSTGLIFTLIITRTLTTDEFGTWGLISGLMIFGIFLTSTVEYWLIRETARKENSGKTGIISSTILSSGGIMIFVILGFFVAEESNINHSIFVFAALLIPFTFINNSLSSVVHGFKPEGVSYAFLISEIIKLPIGLLFIYSLEMGIEGIIITIIISTISSSIILFCYGRNKLNTNIDFEYVKKWFKLSWIPIYRTLPHLLSLSDVVIFSMITGAVSGVAYYVAARTIAILVNHTRYFSYGLYPKLLEGGKQEHLQENIIRVLYFAIPLMALSITLSKPALFLLNPVYVIAFPIVIFLTFKAFLATINKILFDSLQGVEKVDIEKNPKFKDLIKSKLMWFPTFQFIKNGAYFISLAILFYSLDNKVDEIQLVIYWSIVGVIIEIPIVVYVIIKIKKQFSLDINILQIGKFVVAVIISFGIIYLVMEEFMTYNERIFEFLPQLIIFTLIGITQYLVLTYILDSKTRTLFKNIINELKRK